MLKRNRFTKLTGLGFAGLLALTLAGCGGVPASGENAAQSPEETCRKLLTLGGDLINDRARVAATPIAVLTGDQTEVTAENYGKLEYSDTRYVIGWLSGSNTEPVEELPDPWILVSDSRDGSCESYPLTGQALDPAEYSYDERFALYVYDTAEPVTGQYGQAFLSFVNPLLPEEAVGGNRVRVRLWNLKRATTVVPPDTLDLLRALHGNVVAVQEMTLETS